MPRFGLDCWRSSPSELSHVCVALFIYSSLMSFGKPPSSDRRRLQGAPGGCDPVEGRGRRIQSEPFLPPIFNVFGALASRAQHQYQQPQHRKLQKPPKDSEEVTLGRSAPLSPLDPREPCDVPTASLAGTVPCDRDPHRTLDCAPTLRQRHELVSGLHERETNRVADPSTRDESVFSDSGADDMSVLSAASTARHSSFRQRSRSEGRCKDKAARTPVPMRAQRALPQAQLELSIVVDDACENPPLSIEIESSKENVTTDAGGDDERSVGAEPSSAVGATRAANGVLYANQTGPLHGVVRLGFGMGSSAQFSLTATRSKCMAGRAAEAPNHMVTYDGVQRQKVLLIDASSALAAEVSIGDSWQAVLSMVVRAATAAELKKQDAVDALLKAEQSSTKYSTLSAQIRRGRARGVETLVLERATAKLKTLDPQARKAKRIVASLSRGAFCVLCGDR